MKSSSHGLRRRAIFVGSLAIVGVTASSARAIKIVSYNILNFNGSARVADHRTIAAAIVPDLIVTQEVVSAAGAQAYLNSVLNGPGGPGGYALATYYNGPDTNNALFYRTSRFTYNASDPEAFVRLVTALRDIDRWKLRLVGYTSAGADLYIYSMHLKAGTSSSDQNQRLAEATVVRTNGNTLPTGANFIYAGDFNIQSSSESSYSVQLTGSLPLNNGRGFDPINRPGTWNNNSSFKDIHTQSPCSTSPCPGTNGGMDDRFDFQLVSAGLIDGVGFDYVPGTYVAYGNDAQHFNTDINGGGFNNAVGYAMASSLRAAADHLPLIAEYQAPAKISASSMAFGTAIVGATATRTLTVTNTADLALFTYADELNYTLPAAPTGFSGPAGAFADNPGGAGVDHVYAMDTSAAGPRSGSITIASDADTPSIDVSFSGSVVTHARPSTEAAVETASGVIDFGEHGVGEFTDQTARVYNVGYSSLQAVLEVYDAVITGPGAARFGLPNGFDPTFVAGSPANVAVAFDDAGAGPGTYAATLTFRTRDPASITGGTLLADVSYLLKATIPSVCPDPTFDSDDDGDVDVTDFTAFQFCFGGANNPYGPGCACLDGDDDGDVDVADFTLFQLCFGGADIPADPACDD